MLHRQNWDLLCLLFLLPPAVAAFIGSSKGISKHVLSATEQRAAVRPRTVEVSYTSHSDLGDSIGSSKPVEIPLFITSPVLQLVYPALLRHIEEFGNPNIPLGSTDGKRCKTLRRLHFQNKLTDKEVELLTEIGFRFHSFEDVYNEIEFEDMFKKLVHYYQQTNTFQIPKKYDPDPELGAWVTMLRRLYRLNELPQNEIDCLDEVGFEWVSTRKCGSSFMSYYRKVLAHLNEVMEAGGDVRKLLEEEHEIRKWIDSQRLSWENGRLSDSRCSYMDKLPGIDWKNPTSWA